MTKLIGHRGAAGLALENSAASIKAALKSDIDVIEFDVHRTKDDKLVMMHDDHTGRVATQKVYVRDVTLAELQKISLKNGQPIPTLDDCLHILGSKPLIIDIKDEGSADELLRVLEQHPKARISVASFKHGELKRIGERRPDIPMYVLEHFSPFDIIDSARHLRAQGIGLNKWLMNPLTYKRAQRHHIELYVYTVNWGWLGKFFKKLYPDVTICTDHPERFTSLRVITKD
ncbi:MAG TPA: glycerophosphodiester phosphodiesterase [Bacillota bacterium]|nr:glycerophosphodiester phosphodiesterase [Bacillota bacterium]